MQTQKVRTPEKAAAGAAAALPVKPSKAKKPRCEGSGTKGLPQPAKDKTDDTPLPKPSKDTSKAKRGLPERTKVTQYTEEEEAQKSSGSDAGKESSEEIEEVQEIVDEPEGQSKVFCSEHGSENEKVEIKTSKTMMRTKRKTRKKKRQTRKIRQNQ